MFKTYFLASFLLCQPFSVQDLGDDSFYKRETAHSYLASNLFEHEAEIFEAQKSDDAEIAFRAKKLAAQLEAEKFWLQQKIKIKAESISLLRFIDEANDKYGYELFALETRDDFAHRLKDVDFEGTPWELAKFLNFSFRNSTSGAVMFSTHAKMNTPTSVFGPVMAELVKINIQESVTYDFREQGQHTNEQFMITYQISWLPTTKLLRKESIPRTVVVTDTGQTIKSINHNPVSTDVASNSNLRNQFTAHMNPIDRDAKRVNITIEDSMTFTDDYRLYEIETEQEHSVHEYDFGRVHIAITDRLFEAQIHLEDGFIIDTKKSPILVFNGTKLDIVQYGSGTRQLKISRLFTETIKKAKLQISIPHKVHTRPVKFEFNDVILPERK